MTRYKGSDKESTSEFGSTRQYADGRQGWTAFHLSMVDGTEIHADVAESVGRATADELPNELSLKGHVRFRTSDGVVIEADQLHYLNATGQAAVDGPVRFSRGHMTGSGTGATYARETGVFALLADAHMTTVATPEGGGAVDATARTMTFNRSSNALLFEDHAQIVHDADVMSADRATLYFTEDHEQFRVIELRGHSRVQPAAGQTAASPDMQAEDIDLAFYDGTQNLQRAVLMRQATLVLADAAGRRRVSASTLVLSTAPDGKTMTHLEGTDHVDLRTPARQGMPERRITAASLVATGDDANGLTLAQFAGGVRFVETTPAQGSQQASVRTGTSASLNLKLKGQLDAIDEAQFQQGVRFEDGDVAGDADLGIYLAGQGRMTLRPFDRAPKRLPRVTDGAVTVDAGEFIEIDLNANDLHAQRDVKTVTTGGGKAAGAGDTGLFNADAPLYGQGAEFWYVGATKQARYAGTTDSPANVRQKDNSNSVTGLDVSLSNDSKDLSAKGQVESLFVLARRKPGSDVGCGRWAAGRFPAAENADRL